MSDLTAQVQKLAAENPEMAPKLEGLLRSAGGVTFEVASASFTGLTLVTYFGRWEDIHGVGSADDLIKAAEAKSRGRKPSGWEEPLKVGLLNLAWRALDNADSVFQSFGVDVLRPGHATVGWERGSATSLKAYITFNVKREGPTEWQFQQALQKVRMASPRRKRANPALARTLVLACASSSTCRNATAKALRFPGGLVDMWYDAVGDLADEAAEGMLTEGQERGFRKLYKVMTTLGRVQFAPLDMLADALESMNNDDAEILSKLAEK